jgi:hypothetical protein
MDTKKAYVYATITYDNGYVQYQLTKELYRKMITFIGSNVDYTIINNNITTDEINKLRTVNIISKCKDKTLCELVINKVIDILNEQYGIYKLMIYL